MKKRLFTLLLAVVMVLSLFPALSQTAEAAEYYDLWVDGVRVSSANCSDILGDGSIWYTPSTQTLWVYNANITTPYTFDTGENRTAFVYSDGIDLTIRGSATITGIGNYGINVSNGTLTVNADLNITLSNSGNFYAAIAMKCTDDITIRGGTMNLTTTHGDIYAPAGDITIIGGRLTLKGGGIYSAIEAKGSVTITDGVEYVDATSSYGAIRSDASSISIGSGLTVTEPANPVYGEFVYQSDGSTKATHVVTAQAYSLWVGGVQVNVMNRDDILGDGGKAQYNPDTNTLTLNNPSITNTYSESVSKPKLFIYANSMNLKVVGSATMSGPANFGIRVLYGTLTVDGDFNIDPKYPNNGYSTTALAGWNGVSILGGTMVLTGDSDVVEARYGDITISGGSVTATGRSSNYAALCAQSGDVIITNGVRCVEATGSTAGAIGAGTDHSVVLGDALSVTEPADAVIGQNIYESDGSTKARHVVIVPAYDLWVGGVRVTSLNQDDILGDGGKAQYNPDTHELTLNNPTLTGSYPSEGSNAVIYSEMPSLALKGKAAIDAAGHAWGVFAGQSSGGIECKLILDGDFTVTGATAYDLLSHGDFTVWDGDLTCGSIRSFRQNVRVRGGTVTATDSIMAEYNIYITNGIKKVDVAGTYSAFFAYGETLSLGDELIISKPDPSYISNGKVYDSATDQVAKHVVIVNPNAFPFAITQQPVDYVGKVNSTADFSVEATGVGLKYQWQLSTNGGKSWSNSSVTTDTYSAKLTAAKDGRMVRCIVTDADGNSVISDPATMRIYKFAITAQPSDVMAKANETVTFRVAAQGDGLSYQWQISDNGGKKWSNSSVKEAEYTTKLTAARDGRLVRCIVTDAYGTKLTSDPAAMRLEQFAILSQPQSVTAKLNDSVTFTVTASGSGLTYQWQISDNGGKKWTNSSVKSAVYSAKLTAAKDGRMVRCIVTDSSGNSVISEPAVMRIYKFAITAQPSDVMAKANETVTFRVAAQGDGLSYQWQISDNGGKKWSNSSVKEAEYTTKLTAARDGRMVRCIVTDGNGETLISNAAKMTIG